MENRSDREDPRVIEIILPRSVELVTRERPPEPLMRAAQLRSHKRLAIWLFLATCVSTFIVGAGMHAMRLEPQLVLALYERGELWKVIHSGAVYSAALMSILLFHEFGHYLQARRYNVPASPPFFIPMPFPPFGTMGAVIIQGAGVADRKQMFDIAITGPLAGLLIALPAMYFGILESPIVPENPDRLRFGEPLVIKWTYETLKRPLAPGEDIAATPLMFAGWVGIFITALNLIPIGQLDGGHILYSLIGKRAHGVAIALLLAAIGYMIWSRQFAYGLMIVLLVLMGPRHPPTADDTVPLGPFRVALGWLTLGFIVIGFTPTPIVNMP